MNGINPSLLGVTNLDVPSWRVTYLSILKRFHELGVTEINGHLLYEHLGRRLSKLHSPGWKARASSPPCRQLLDRVPHGARSCRSNAILKKVVDQFVDVWQAEAGLKTFGQAVADAMVVSSAMKGSNSKCHGRRMVGMVQRRGIRRSQDKSQSLGLNVTWDCERARTPEGYYPIQGGIEYAIAKSLAVAPFCDLIWMETKTANLEYAKRFADAIHAKFPQQMLAYNLSPSFNWDTTGMTDEQMREFPAELGKLGYVFNFITYGGHQVDGMAAEEFATALQQDGMLSLARLQRKLRLVESPYKTPQTLVGGPRLDGALMASSGRTATTAAMGKGSTQVQHLVQTEVPVRLLDEWLEIWTEKHGISEPLHAACAHTPRDRNCWTERPRFLRVRKRRQSSSLRSKIDEAIRFSPCGKKKTMIARFAASG